MNRLAGETSPYLLQHAGNPVDWYPWGDEALARAREEDKPILLSVGYAACHWCHVMEHESFEDAATAALMNEHFVSVKVDREERPDIDSVYMDAVVSLTGHGGWPMTVFLTPAGAPFFGGTYYPPEPRHGLPSFPQLLQAIADAWRERRSDIERDAGAITEQLRRTAEPSREPLTSSLLTDAVRGLRQQFDPEWGGFGPAPKFPPASVLEFLLRRDEVELATKTLDAMVAGGMYDLVGGGFHRYSVDRQWLVPHFEKMLYDNALLVPVYLHGWLVTGNERYREIATETLDYMLRDLALEEGGFASAEDADTDGVEGLTYTWLPEDGVPAELLQPFEHGRFVIRGELDPELRLHSGGMLGEELLHPDRASEGPLRVVLVCDRCAEEREDRITHQPGRRALVAVDRRDQLLEDLVHDVGPRFGIEALRHRRRTDDVAEQHRHGAPLTLHRPTIAPEGTSGLVDEPCKAFGTRSSLERRHGRSHGASPARPRGALPRAG